MRINVNEIRQQILAINAVCGGNEDERLLLDMLEGETDLDSVLNYFLKQLAEYDAAIIGKKAVIKEWQDANKNKELQIEKTRDLIMQLLQDAGLQSYKTPLGNIVIAKGRDGLVIDETLTYDNRFYKVVKTLDKTLIKDAIASGETINGVTKSNAKPHITIRK